MFEMTDVIVGFWFLPVTIFIIIPLLMLCGYGVGKLFGQPKTKNHIPHEKDQLKDAVNQTKGSR